MSSPDFEHKKSKQPEEKERLITFDEAQTIIEREMPESIRGNLTPTQASLRKEQIFHFITATLLEEGDTRPLTIVQARIGDEIKPRVTKTIKEWHHYWALAALNRAGVKTDFLKRPQK